MSACVGRAELMDHAWPLASGEAIHTSTFLGHPVGCAMALRQIGEIASRNLPKRARDLGNAAIAELRSVASNRPGVAAVRGRGLMIGVELQRRDTHGSSPIGMRVVKGLLNEGWIVLPEGEHAEVIAFTPPLIISKQQMKGFASSLARVLDRILSGLP